MRSSFISWPKAASDILGAVVFSTILTTFVLLIPAIATAGVYKIEAIAMPHEGSANVAMAINNHGEIVGNVWLPNHLAGYFWSNKKGVQLLPPSRFHQSTNVHDINERGDVTGWSRNEQDDAVPTIWINGNKPRQLLTLGGSEGIGFGLNDRRDLVGHTLPNDYTYRHQATVWLKNKAPLNPDPDNHTRSMAIDINNSGVVIGYTWHLGYPRAFTWSEDNGFNRIHAPNDRNYLRPYAINNSGWFTGITRDRTQITRPVLVNPDGEVRLIIHENLHATGLGINDHNTIVGEIGIYATDMHAMVWDELNGMRDLNNLIDPLSGWSLTRAYDINNRGQIVGRGIFEGQTRGFLLTPIPEPATLLIYLTGSTLCTVRSSIARPIQH